MAEGAKLVQSNSFGDQNTSPFLKTRSTNDGTWCGARVAWLVFWRYWRSCCCMLLDRVYVVRSKTLGGLGRYWRSNAFADMRGGRVRFQGDIFPKRETPQVYSGSDFSDQKARGFRFFDDSHFTTSLACHKKNPTSINQSNK